MSSSDGDIPQPPSSQPLLWLSGAFIAIHSCLFGASISCLGPFLKQDTTGAIMNDIPLDTVQQSAATALLLLACIPGAFFTSFFVAKYGQRTVLLFNSLIWMFAGFVLCFNYAASFMVGRFILGIATGVSSVIPPVLLADIATRETRGVLASFHQLAICLCILVVYLFAYPLVYVEHGWRWLNAVMFIILGFISLLCGFLIPESPMYLMKTNRENEALETLFYLRHGTWTHLLNNIKQMMGDRYASITNQPNPYQPQHNVQGAGLSPDDDINNYPTSDQVDPFAYDLTQQNISINNNSHKIIAAQSPPDNIDSLNADDPVHIEIQQLRDSLSSSQSEIGWKDLLLDQYRFQLLICFALMVLQPLIGINAICMFATKIFGFCGLSDTGAMLGTIAIGVLGLVFSLVATVLINKIGRRNTIVLGCTGCAVSLCVLSVALLAMSGDSSGYLALVATLCYVAFFNIGLGGPIWVILSELTSSVIVNKAQSVYCVINWATNFLLVFGALPAMTVLGGGEDDEALKAGAGFLFILFIFVGIGGALFTWFLVVETLNVPSHVIQEELGNSSKQQPVDVPVSVSIDDGHITPI